MNVADLVVGRSYWKVFLEGASNRNHQIQEVYLERINKTIKNPNWDPEDQWWFHFRAIETALDVYDVNAYLYPSRAEAVHFLQEILTNRKNKLLEQLTEIQMALEYFI